jgi:hypothetical protein
MAGKAIDFCMGVQQIKPGLLAMVKVDLYPAMCYVALATAYTEPFLVNIVTGVTADTLSRRRPEVLDLVATVAGSGHVIPDKEKPRGSVIETHLTPVAWFVTGTAGFAEATLVAAITIICQVAANAIR